MLVLLRSGPQTAHDTTAQPVTEATGLAFHWRSAVLPLAVLVLTIALVAYFYRLLPEEVVYRFGAEGSPDEWTGRGTIVLWALLPQLFLTLLAIAVAWGVTKLSTTFKQMEGFGINLDTIALVMGNMIALPQAILFFAMLDIFSYNSYEFRILPLWVIALIIMALGAVILGIFFIRSMRQVRGNQ
ncbi:MAG TPA: DUF1648 domain-containing protein [Dehalococcoidia bacterium]|nr:DUF1648 domain-containing protein [Dehalococcoidia bacterium]